MLGLDLYVDGNGLRRYMDAIISGHAEDERIALIKDVTTDDLELIEEPPLVGVFVGGEVLAPLEILVGQVLQRNGAQAQLELRPRKGVILFGMQLHEHGDDRAAVIIDDEAVDLHHSPVHLVEGIVLVVLGLLDFDQWRLDVLLNGDPDLGLALDLTLYLLAGLSVRGRCDEVVGAQVVDLL